MPVAIATISSELRSQFLNGLAQPDRKTILSAATQRRFAADSVVTNQGHPADHLFLLTKGCARHSSLPKRGRSFSLSGLYRETCSAAGRSYRVGLYISLAQKS